MISRCLIVLTCSLTLSGVWADPILIAREHTDMSPFALVIKTLEAALQASDAPTSLIWADATDMNQTRAIIEMEQCNAPFDVYFTGYDATRESRLLQVDVPLTGGLLGVRVLAVRNDRVDELAARVNQPRGLVIGSGSGWPGTRILQSYGYSVQTAPYLSLWQMLESGRVDAFQRGIQEAQLELASRPELTTLPNTLFIFPMDFFLYVSPCRADLHQQLTETLTAFADSGALEQLLRKDPTVQNAIAQLSQPETRVRVMAEPDDPDPIYDLLLRYGLTEVQALLRQQLAN
ncbi:hypothetical protein [Reinekea blandensis]|uniref:Solute-binding protein family 3/N-terminal domain-containing protein n=1 Tax=Reinekea blandensis MED297 TaxID=314283 RepID=A4BAB7_9GAMM|nr:hypothetical protein [Reinekea blandensis]EAR10873.1 hypothetical protein MED297_10196 [Reinekea sp. MED297] [Reinekea blandensis MED297]